MSTPQPGTRTGPGPGAPHPGAHSHTTPGTELTPDAAATFPTAQLSETNDSDPQATPENRGKGPTHTPDFGSGPAHAPDTGQESAPDFGLGSAYAPDLGGGPAPDSGSGPAHAPDAGQESAPDFGLGSAYAPDLGGGPAPDFGSGPAHAPDAGQESAPDFGLGSAYAPDLGGGPAPAPAPDSGSGPARAPDTGQEPAPDFGLGSAYAPDLGGGPAPDFGSGPAHAPGSGQESAPDFGLGSTYAPDLGGGPAPDFGSGPARAPDAGQEPAPDFGLGSAYAPDLGGGPAPAPDFGAGPTQAPDSDSGPARAPGSGPELAPAHAPGPGPAHGPGASSAPRALPPLSGGESGPASLRPLLSTVLTALSTGSAARPGPLPSGGPRVTAERLRGAAGPLLPATGTGPRVALRTLVHALAAGAADPAHPHCAAHLHCPPLAVAVAADLAASALNPSMDSWDQAPAASALEETLTRTLAAEIYPYEKHPDALVTTGGTESNQLALLLAREKHADHGPVQLVVGANAHHSLSRAAWLLGLPEPVVVPAPTGTLELAALDGALTRLHHRPLLVAATAGTTDTGQIDPIPEIADLCDRHGADLHIDAAYAGPLLFSPTHRHLLTGLDRAHTLTLDLHKLGWQPVAAGLIAVPDATVLAPLAHQADYLNADDDTDAGLPDLLGRSLRTSRRPDALKIAVTLKSLGRDGLAELIDRTLAAAHHLADLVEAHPDLELYDRPTLSTVLFRPTGSTDEDVAEIRRRLLTEGRAVLGRTHTAGHLWLKATLLNPHTTPDDLEALLEHVGPLSPSDTLSPSGV